MPTLCELFRATVERAADRPALSADGATSISWREYGERVDRLAAGLSACGLGAGDTVALMTANTPDFHVADMAVMHLAAVPFSIHGDDPADDLADRIRVAAARFLITEQAYLDRAREVAAATHVEWIVVLDSDGAPGGSELSAGEVVARGAGDGAPAAWRSVTAEDTATLIFTSGTTGRPKAVQLPHRAVAVSLESFVRLTPGGTDGRVLTYLPLTHIAERFMSYYLAIAYGAEIICVTDPDELYATIARVRPTRFFGVPRVYTKLAARARELIAADPALSAAYAAGDVAALAPVGLALGLDLAAYRGVATAPSSREMLEFFAALGLPVGDIWGMSEAIMCTANPTGRIKVGTVGRLLDGVEARVAADGELLVRGPNTFIGYLGDPVRTAELRGPDGWLHTGDLGTIDDEAYLTIIGRKKELMITATGKNIVPAVIEDAVRNASSLIDHAVAIADGRRFVSVLVALDPQRLDALAGRLGLSGHIAELVSDAGVEAEVASAVRTANATLPRAEAVRSWRIVPAEWRPGGDEVTATMKLRRSEIARKYAAVIEEMYRTP